ncbi:MAG: hypothetical protein V3T58_02930 [Candidatus Hydrothermarchaeales archaeon]
MKDIVDTIKVEPSYLLSLNPVVVVKVLIPMLIMVSLFLFFGALGAGIEEVTWEKVLFASIVAIGAQWITATILSIIPVIGGILGFIFSILVMIYILRISFLTTWGKAATAFALAAVAELTTGAILQLYLGINFLSFVQRLFFVA